MKAHCRRRPSPAVGARLQPSAPISSSRRSSLAALINSTLSRCPSDSISLSFFLWCSRQPDFFHARDSLDVMIPVLRRLTFKLRSVADIVEELEAIGSPAEAKTFLMLMRVYCRGDMFIFAREVFDEMGRRGFVPNTLARNLIIDGLFKSGQFCEGMRFFRETQTPNFFTFNIVMRNLCERRDWRGVRGVLREMVRRGFQFNVGSFTSSLDCFKKVGRIKEAFQLVGFMLVSGLRPTVEIWSILIAVLCQAGNVPLGFGLFGKIIDSRSLPTVVTYTFLIKGLLKARMLSEAIGVWDIMVIASVAVDRRLAALDTKLY